MTNPVKDMRRDWDERARSSPFRYIASWRNDWDEASFFESGERDYLQWVEPILQKLQIDPSNRSMVELGCGAGRMTRSFAKRFRHITAVDISPEMQTLGKKYLQSSSNVSWVVSDGEHLSEIKTNSLDFVFSYLVLQHMPNKEVVFTSIQEMMRVLIPGGGFLFQFNGSDAPNMNLKGRVTSKVLDQLSSLGLKNTAQSLARLAGIDPGMVGNTWRGVVTSEHEVQLVLRTNGAGSAEFINADSPMAWCYGSKHT